MNRYAELMEWLKTAQGRTCAVICTITACLVAGMAWLTFAQPIPAPFYEDFSGAHWIQVNNHGTIGYFRKKFYVTSRVQQAWICVAANDYYELNVNGFPLILPANRDKTSPLVTGSFISGDQETEFDLAPYLISGENCISIYAKKRMKDRDLGILVKARVVEATHDQWIYSDESWKAKPVPDDMIGSTTWTLPYTNDENWPQAQILDRPVPGNRVQPLSIPPAVFEHAIQAKWIGAPDPSERQAYFRRDFYSSWTADSTWLTVSSTGDFEVYLNDRLVTDSKWLSEQTLLPAAVGLQTAGQLNFAEMIDLKPWLGWGKNRIEIRSSGAAQENAVLAEVLSVHGDGSVASLPSDASWLVHGSSASARWVQAHELAKYGDPPYGGLLKLSFTAPKATQEMGRETFNGFILAFLILGLWWLAWIIFPRALAVQRSIPYQTALVLDVLAQIPIAVAVVLLFFSTCDIRLSPDWAFKPLVFWTLMAVSLVLRWALWIWPVTREPRTIPMDRFPATRQFVRSYGFGIALLVLMVTAFIIRVSGLMIFPLDFDEIFMRNCTHGVVERGFPSEEIHGLLYRLTTYELVPWPEFICAALTGWPDWSLRIPSLIFGTITTGLIGYFGSRWFDRRTGLLAALLYTFNSWNVAWSRHCFHLQQTQMIALLCFYTFYLAIREGKGVDRKYFYWACTLFCCTYLSWEGSGFIIPVFALLLLVMNPGDWSWLKQFHFWVGLIITSCVVLSQLADRAITLPPYLAIGFGLGDISSPTLFFLDPNSDITYYFAHMFLSEAHCLLGVFTVLGLFLYWNHRPTRYVLVLLFSLMACYSGLLPVYSIRYFYFYQSLLILGGCAVAVRSYDQIVALAKSVDWSWAGRWARGSAALILLLMFLAGGEFGLKIYRLTYFTEDPVFFSRYNDTYFDFVVPTKFITDRIKPGDVVICLAPHTYMHYTGKFAYGFDPLLATRLFFVDGMGPSAFADRYSGTPAIRNLHELQDIFQSHSRVWFVASPLFFFDTRTDPPSKAFIESTCRLVYEDPVGRTYLWDGTGGDITYIPDAPPAIIPSGDGATLNPQAIAMNEVHPPPGLSASNSPPRANANGGARANSRGAFATPAAARAAGYPAGPGLMGRSGPARAVGANGNPLAAAGEDTGTDNQAHAGGVEHGADVVHLRAPAGTQPFAPGALSNGPGSNEPVTIVSPANAPMGSRNIKTAP